LNFKKIPGESLRTQRPDLLFLGVIVVALLFAVGLTWINFNILVPTGGDNIFAPIWEATRYLIGDGGNPYSPGAVLRANLLLEDAALAPRFVYPYYSIPFFAPFALIASYSLARAVWMTVMFACLVGLVFTALSFTRWQPRAYSMLIYLLFAFGSIFSVRAFYLGNPALLVAFLVAVGLSQVIQKRYGVAGVFFGLTIIKPQMVVFFLVFVVLWAISKRHLGMVSSLILTILILMGGAFAVSPVWVFSYYFQLLEFFNETFPASFAAKVWVWLPDSGAVAMGIVAGLIFVWMLIEWWRALGKESRWFLWTAALTLTLTQFIGLPTSISNQVILLIPFALVFSLWSQRWQKTGNILSIIAMLVLLAGGWLGYFATMPKNLTAQAGALMQSFLPFLALILLYWVRYWALSSVRLQVSHLEALRRL
jgi:hypothetical protein